MNQFEQVYEFAADNYGVVTVGDAKQLGIHRKEMLNWTRMGRLKKCGRGVYRLVHYIPTEYDRFAEAVAIVGGDAMVYGEGVLALHNLALVNPPYITVACSRRLRREIPIWIRVVKKSATEVADNFNGIAAQALPDAIRVCRNTVLTERLIDAVRVAEDNGYMTKREADELRKELV